MKHIVVLLIFSLLLTGCGQQSQPIHESKAALENLSPSEALSTEPSSEEATAENATDFTVSEEANERAYDEADEQAVYEEGISKDNEDAARSTITEPAEYDYVLEFPSDSYPETALHIYSAIENGHSDVCTIDRDGADERRKQSLKGIQTKEGYDRDEWPMAMCAEGGEGASVAYVDSSDNRGAGSWVGHQLSAYEDGEKILFIVSKPKSLFGKNNPVHEQPSNADSEQHDLDLKLDEELSVVYKNCTEAHEAGVTPLFEGDPGYSKKLDRDGDGVACEL